MTGLQIGAVLALKSEFNTTSVGIGLSVSLALVGSAVGAVCPRPKDLLHELKRVELGIGT